MATEIRALLDEGAAKLARTSDTPRRDAEVLLGAALGRDRAWLLANPEERVLDCAATDRYESYLTRRAHGEPVAYLLGEKEFWSLPLRVGPGVLVPRPETELVVERAIAHFPADAAFAALDIAAGSGAIAVALASERPRCTVVATDIDPAAIEATNDNAQRLGLADRITVLEGEWFRPVADRRFDLIASNPPYIALGDPRVEPAVRRYEPPQALFAGPGGLEALEAIVAGAPRHLQPGGWLVLEHGDTQAAAVRLLLTAAGFIAVRTFRDLAGRDRCTEGQLPGQAAPEQLAGRIPRQ